jgi:hypothetical protein
MHTPPILACFVHPSAEHNLLYLFPSYFFFVLLPLSPSVDSLFLFFLAGALRSPPLAAPVAAVEAVEEEVSAVLRRGVLLAIVKRFFDV